jgi:3-hydroxyisobutyrate dehydrogenase-like beta-hydroxyacid dehydrogenase
MAQQNVGILNPGDMGISVAATIHNSGHAVYWASEGRSPQTRARAEQHGLIDAGSLANICQTCAVIVSVVPPDAAEALAAQVLSQGFKGLFIDANAIAPGRAVRIGDAMNAAGASFVDGGIIGGPAWKANTTWLYLSGEAAAEAADYFAAGPLETRVIGDAVGKASALKMCFAAYTKGTTALLSAVLAAAESLDVRAELEQQWSQNGSNFAEQSANSVRNVTAKAWRFAGEMEEIAATFAQAGLPDEFHLAAADIYRRMADFKSAPETPSLEAVLSALLHTETRSNKS